MTRRALNSFLHARARTLKNVGMLQPLRRAQVVLTAQKVRREMRGKTFLFHDKPLPYAIFEQAHTYNSERCIEVAIGEQFLTTHPDVLEVGNVMSQFFPSPHPVVDKYEHGRGVRNEDVLQLTEIHQNILSISTLEHVGFDEPGDGDHTKFFRAVETLRALARDTLLITVPWGYNPSVDAFIRSCSGTSRQLADDKSQFGRPSRPRSYSGAGLPGNEAQPQPTNAEAPKSPAAWGASGRRSSEGWPCHLTLYYRDGREWRQGTLAEIAPRTYHSHYWYANAIAVVEFRNSSFA